MWIVDGNSGYDSVVGNPRSEGIPCAGGNRRGAQRQVRDNPEAADIGNGPRLFKNGIGREVVFPDGGNPTALRFLGDELAGQLRGRQQSYCGLIRVIDNECRDCQRQFGGNVSTDAKETHFFLRPISAMAYLGFSARLFAVAMASPSGTPAFTIAVACRAALLADEPDSL